MASVAYGEKIQQAAEQAQHAIWDEVGYEFNVNSPKQLGEALFGKLGLPHGKKTKNGYSTNADVLEKLRYESTAVENVLQYRTYAKLKSTYCDGAAWKVIGPDGRIHSRFNQTETRTGTDQLHRTEFAEYSGAYGTGAGNAPVLHGPARLGAGGCRLFPDRIAGCWPTWPRIPI